MQTARSAFLLVMIAAVPLVYERSIAKAQTFTCTPSKVTALSLREENQRLFVDTVVNGIKMPMMLDIGWSYTSLTKTATDQLSLKSAPSVWKTNGLDGSFESRDVFIDSFLIGTVRWKESTIHVTQLTTDEYNGVIGNDFLSKYDVDFDFSNHRLTLYEPSGCAPVIDVGTSTTLPTAANFTSENMIIVVARIDEKAMPAIIDTGATSLFVTKEAAIKILGVAEGDYNKAPTAPATGVARANNAGHLMNFHHLKISDLNVNSPTIEVVESSLRGFGLIIGMEYLKGQRFWVSYKYKRFIPLPTDITPLK